MHHSDFIAILARMYKPNVYVELGLYEGETLTKTIPYIGKGYGVDMVSKPALERLKSVPKLQINYETTNSFFEHFNQGIDMAFIDADHCYESVLVDFEKVYNRLNPGGIIILHDTDPESNHLFNPGYCGDSYRMVKYLEDRPDVNCTTFPLTEAGLTIVTKKNDTRTTRRGITL
jgi:hypothetical protein